MWIARDYNGTLRLHIKQPKRNGYVWESASYFGSPRSVTLVQTMYDEDPFPKLKWTDNPIQVKFVKA